MNSPEPTADWDQRLGFWWIAEDHPDHPAILESPDGPRTYAELAGDAHQIVHLLRSLGLKSGDAIGIAADNGLALIETSLACHEAGLWMIPLNTHLTAVELKQILEHSEAKVLLLASRLAHLVKDLDTDALGLEILTIGEPTDEAKASGLESVSGLRSSQPRTKPNDREPGGLFAYTSGTTGKPKGIRRPIPAGDVDELGQQGALFARAFDFTPFTGPMLVSTGMFHGGSHSFYIGGLHAGQSLVVLPRFDAEKALALIEKYGVRTGYMVPTQFHRFLHLPEDVRNKYDLSSLHSIVHGAAPCPKGTKERMMAWWGPVIWETYGGMEGPATIAKPYRWLEKPGTVGRSIRGVTLSIKDDDGNILGPNEVGHVYMENDIGFTYHGDPEQTKAAFSGKSFSLGDIGHLDEDGYLFLSDRAKDMIITGGVNVYPAEVEAALLQHPGVYDVGVIGIPDSDWGESVIAVVQAAEGFEADQPFADELMEFARTNLSSYKCPRRVDFRTTMPRTEAGKLYKRQIKDEYLQAAD